MIIFNGRSVSSFSSFLFIVALVAMGWLLLPLIGGFLILLLLLVAGVFLYGVYWKWRYGDPVKKMQEEFIRKMHEQNDPNRESSQDTAYADVSEMKRGERTLTGVKRTTTVEDAVIVEEVRRK